VFDSEGRFSVSFFLRDFISHSELAMTLLVIIKEEKKITNFQKIKLIGSVESEMNVFVREVNKMGRGGGIFFSVPQLVVQFHRFSTNPVTVTVDFFDLYLNVIGTESYL
jgi:hypothetical protein